MNAKERRERMEQLVAEMRRLVKEYNPTIVTAKANLQREDDEILLADSVKPPIDMTLTLIDEDGGLPVGPMRIIMAGGKRGRP